MKYFLEQVITAINQRETSFHNLIFIVPNKRAAIFLKRTLINHTKETSYLLPTIYGIEDFINSLVDLQKIDYIQLIFEFYQVYLGTNTSDPKESFENFIPWASTILKDFNEVDSNCLPAKDFFSYLKNSKEQEHWSLSENPTELINNYLKFWNNIGLYYENFTQHLKSRNIGHAGLLYRTAAQEITSYCKSTKDHHIFMGFNALNRAEEIIMTSLVDNEKAEIFIDVDISLLEANYHSASYFIRKYVKEWTYFKDHPIQFATQYFSQKKEIKIIGASQGVGQAKIAGKILESIAPADQEKTAVVLGDESLLSPMLQSIPNNVEAVNITMGMPLKSIPLHSFFQVLMDAQISKGTHGFYYQYVIRILSDSAINRLIPDLSKRLLTAIKVQNKVFAKSKYLIETTQNVKEKEIMELLFLPWDTIATAIQACLQLINHLKMKVSTEENPVLFTNYYYFHKVFSQLSNFYQKYGSITSLETLRYFYLQILNNETIDFIGEPLQGLQIMGMLETRCLDFETVIVTSVNEGIMPVGNTNNSSFIPFDLKKIYQLPSFKERDAIYAYNFYHLLQRAKKIYLIYNTENEGVGGGEKSRFIQQLIIDKKPNHDIEEKIGVVTVPKIKVEKITIQKSEDILQKLRNWAAHGISPSALTTYIRNPLEFYNRYVLGIKEEITVEKTIAANTLGTIIHNTLENLYKPLINKELSGNQHKFRTENINNEIVRQFEKEYAVSEDLQGKNLLIFEVAKQYIYRFIKLQDSEIKKENLTILSLEDELKTQFSSDLFNFPILLKGKVDRVDQINGSIRILDYKTGKVLENELKIKNMDQVHTDYKFSKAFQVLMYTYLYSTQPGNSNDELYGSIISFKNLTSGFLKLQYKDGTGFKHTIDNNCRVQFHAVLENLLKEIFDKDIPFVEKET